MEKDEKEAENNKTNEEKNGLMDEAADEKVQNKRR